jgi:phospholipid transport system substrate-binding protein
MEENSLKTALVLLMLAWLACPGALLAEEPMEALKQPVEKVIAVLTDPQYDDAGRIDEQRRKIWEITNSVFDFELIAKRAAGRYHWQNSFTSEQRREFTDLFAEFLANVYLSRITGNYSKIEVEFVEQQMDDSGKRAQVKTVVTREKTPTPVEYSMWRREDGWKVYDVFVENVSLVQNYQTQFRSLLDKESGQQLIERLRDKIEAQKKEGVKESG